MSEIEIGQICQFYHADPRAWFGWEKPTTRDLMDKSNTILLSQRTFVVLECLQSEWGGTEYLILGRVNNSPAFCYVMDYLILESDTDKEEDYE
jgi:hypothetical protein